MPTDTPTTGELYPAALREALTAAAWDALSHARANGTLLDELAKLTDIAEDQGRAEGWAQGFRDGVNAAGTEGEPGDPVFGDLLDHLMTPEEGTP